jgi:hypothetical protein
MYKKRPFLTFHSHGHIATHVYIYVCLIFCAIYSPCIALADDTLSTKPTVSQDNSLLSSLRQLLIDFDLNQEPPVIISNVTQNTEHVTYTRESIAHIRTFAWAQDTEEGKIARADIKDTLTEIQLVSIFNVYTTLSFMF